MAGRHIEMVELPDEAFELTDEVEVRTATQTEIAASSLSDVAELLEPPAANEDTERLRVRYFQPVPHKFLDLILGVEHTPKSLWTELGGAVMAEGDDELKPLLQWLQVAFHKTRADPATDPPEEPAVMLGNVNDVYPGLRGRLL